MQLTVPHTRYAHMPTILVSFSRMFALSTVFLIYRIFFTFPIIYVFYRILLYPYDCVDISLFVYFL